jgi:glycerophosphoryl diester phosphodiesterase
MFSSWDASRGHGQSPPYFPLILGHRGASARQLENTTRAFEQAIRDGADGVELDVQRCRSGGIFVFHDETLARLAGRPERLVDLSGDAIRAIRLAGGHPIPTLAEALEACGPSALVNIELKLSGGASRDIRALVDAVAIEVRRAGAFPRVVVSSFSPRAVWAWRQRHPRAAYIFERIPRGVAPWPLQPAWLARHLRPFAVHPEATLCTARTVAAWRRLGLRITPWTLDDPAELRRVCALGVDGIITNDPKEARRVLALTP